MSYSDEVSFGYRRKTKIKKCQDPKLPMINFEKRVIDFGDDLELFKIVSVLIMKRVDLDPVDLAPMFGQSDRGPVPDIPDLDALNSPAGDGPAPDDDGAEGEPVRERRRLSDRFGLYRHPDRYGAT